MEMPAGQIAKAVNSLNQGEIIAYPEAVCLGVVIRLSRKF